jgi:transposase
MSAVVMTRSTPRNDHGSMAPSDPEVPERPTRRRFTAEYKLAILKEADGATEAGEIGALLRREGLYSSHLVDWRRQRDAGALVALGRPRGRPRPDPKDREIALLRTDNDRLRRRLGQAEKIIEVQGKVSELLGISLDPVSDENESER